MDYYYKLGVLIVDGCPIPLRQLFLQEARRDFRHVFTTLPDFLLFHRSSILQQIRYKFQRDLIYPPGALVDTDKWDVSLLCALVQALFPFLPYKIISATGKMQTARNTFQHMSSTDKIEETEFNSMWADLDSAIMEVTDHLVDTSFKQTMTDFIQDLKDKPLPVIGFDKIIARLEDLKTISEDVQFAAGESHKILKRTASKSIKRSGKVAKRLNVEDSRIKHMKGAMNLTMQNSLPEDFEPPNESADIERKLQEGHRVVICGQDSTLSLQTALYIVKKMNYNLDRSVIMKKPSDWDLICHEDVDLTLYLDPFGGRNGFRKNLAEKSADVFTQMVDASEEHDEDVRIDIIIVTDVKLLQKFRRNTDHEMTADNAVCAIGTTLEDEELSDDEGHECDKPSCVFCSLVEQSDSYVDYWNRVYGKVDELRQAKDLLEEERIVCITGAQSNNRAMLAANLLSESSRRCLVMRSPLDMHHVKSKYLNYLLIEDLGGKGTFDPTVSQGWYSQFDTLFPMVQQRQIRVVLTCQSSILEECIRQLGRHDILNEKYMIDLGPTHTKAGDVTNVTPGTSSAGSGNNLVKTGKSKPRSRQAQTTTQVDTSTRLVRRIDRVEYARIRLSDDEKNCTMNGSCPLPDGGFLVTDYDNNRLKQLNANFRVVAYLQMPGQPFSVCFNETRSEAAVSLQKEKLIQFVDVKEDGLTLSTRKVDTQYECRGVACRQNVLLWLGLDGNEKLTGIHRYEWEHGTALADIVPRDEAGKISGKLPRQLAISEDGQVLYVAFEREGLLVVGSDGTLIRFMADLSYTYCVCLGDAQSLFVAGNRVVKLSHRHTVLQCDREGRYIRDIATGNQLRYEWPLSISYNMSKLLATFRYDDNAAVFHLK